MPRFVGPNPTQFTTKNLLDVSSASPGNSQILKYNSSIGKYEPSVDATGSGGGGSGGGGSGGGGDTSGGSSTTGSYVSADAQVMAIVFGS